MAESGRFKAVHYGPGVVPDPDCTTSIFVVSCFPRSGYSKVLHFGVESDDELRELIKVLESALAEGHPSSDAPASVGGAPSDSESILRVIDQA